MSVDFQSFAADIAALTNKHGVPCVAVIYLDIDEVAESCESRCMILHSDQWKPSDITKEQYARRLNQIFTEWMKTAGITE